MRIFLSYASEQESLANQIRLKLAAAGYDVFFSAADIRASDGYDERIRSEMAKADRLLFLASPASLDEGCYTQTELALAERRWPNPRGRVMAVMVDGIGAGDLPPYLGAVSSAIQPRGDAASHVAATVIERWPRTIKRFLKPVLWTLVVGGLLTLGLLWYLDRQARLEEEERRANAIPRMTPEEFRLAFEKFNRVQAQALDAKAGKMMEEMTKFIAMTRMVPQVFEPPPEDLPDQPAARLRRLAHWAYPEGDTEEERIAARRRLFNKQVLRGIAKMLSGQENVLTSDTSMLKNHRAPGDDGSLLDWYVAMWTRTLDSSDPFDLREGNRILTGEPSEDEPQDWPMEPTPRKLAQIRMLEQVGQNDEFAQAVLFTSAVVERLDRDGWRAPHPIGKTYDASLKSGSAAAGTLWRLISPDAYKYIVNEYDRQYKAP